jgi:hypothetical protein
LIRLGLRLSLASRGSAVPIVLTATAVAFGTAILLFALSFQPALDVRYDRGAWRETPGPRSPADQVDGTTLISLTSAFVEGRSLVRMDVAALGDGGPIPPGLTRLPEPGEAFVSPALAQLLAQRPSDELDDRFGTIAGTVGERGLSAPNELLVVQGQSVKALQAAGSRAVSAFEMDGQPPTLDWIVSLIVIVALIGAVGPVAVFVASSTRLAAARRERRLVALRLCGATPAQVAMLAAVDALLVTIPGAVIGIALFLLLRPLVAVFELGGLTWFTDAIAPSLTEAVLVVVAVPLVGVASAIVALRRMSISPLGVARRVAAGPPSRLRIVPLVLAVVGLVGSLALGLTDLRDLALVGVAVSVFGVIGGIVILGPLLTSLVGRTLAAGGGPIRLLAGRHLLDDPRASFTAVAGVVMAVFVASMFFGFVAFTSEASRTVRVTTRPTTLYADVAPGSGAALDRAIAAMDETSGMAGIVTVREATLGDPADPDSPGVVAWVADCATLLAAFDLPVASCGDADVHLVTDGVELPARGRLLGYPPDADAEDLAVGSLTAVATLEPDPTVDPFVPSDATLPAGTWPDVLIEPEAVADAGLGLRPLFVAIPTDGSRQSIEQTRTALESVMPTSGSATGAEQSAALTEIVDELGRVVTLGVVMTMVVAGAGLAVAVAGSLIDRRRPFALLRLGGVPLRHLRSVLLLEAAAPLVTVALISAALGVAVCQILLRVTGGLDVPLPDASLALLLVAGVGGALAIVAAALPLVGPVTDLEETRFE